MKCVIQRVLNARVAVEGKVVGHIEQGLLVYVGVGVDDTSAMAEPLARKIAGMRIFEDDEGKINRSVQDVRGDVLAVSNFTLLADARKGRRPTFSAAARPEKARAIFEQVVEHLRRSGVRVATGVFGADMVIQSVAAGPVNIIYETPGLGE